ncbi:uncharacterized protein STEHIDRAFT_80731 [Stereum hirsutum FP-91666 SS1]|uniref:uncharacterized protein n=1 Tax=Stereum hirsutum (strain FP-91666) TaxID=721885 RepID=UPI000444A579|nr:uncharacterized protein STEHIDRAFT_80731 [Stereum hirsutum FP-91666 SS1]EIM85354.1 hypothetical protein STEHIDRAFT_80731 [Stereum hirsutum FP-91666 SS1]
MSDDKVNEKSPESGLNEVSSSFMGRGYDLEDGIGQTQRQLKPRHIQMIGLGGAIGTGLFIGSGYSLSVCGPVAIFLGYVVMGLVLWSVMECLGELSTLYPGAGSFPHFAGRFLDPALGFSIGVSYWYGNAVSFASELSAVTVIIEYWDTPLPLAAWITIFMVLSIILVFLPVRYFGEVEVITSTLKILAFVVLFIVGIVIDLGGAPSHDRIGFRYWRDQPFVQYDGISGATGRFCAFLYSIVGAAYTYLGTEAIVLAAGETSNPVREIPRAIKKVAYRILFFYIGGIMLVGMLVPADNAQLGADSSAAASPFVIAIQQGGISVLPHVLNAVFLVSAWSAGNSYAYISARSLYSLALSRRAPKIFAKVTRHGLPLYATIISCSFGALAYLSISSSASQVFLWLQALTSVSGLINWGCICWTWVRFNKALTVQGVNRSTLPYRGRFMPYTAYFGWWSSWILALISGYNVFLKVEWDPQTFVSAYISIPIFVLLYYGWKWWHHTKFIPLREIDLMSGRGDETHKELTLQEQKEMADAAIRSSSAWGRFLDKVL